MAERDLIQQLDRAVDALMTGGPAAPTGPEVTELLRIGAFVRDLPNEAFRIKLKGELMTQASVTPKIDWIRKGFHSVTPYLHPRSAAAFIDFAKQAFGAEEIARYTAPDGGVMHAEIRIGDSMVEMGELPEGDKPVAIHLYVEDVDAVYQRALEAGAISTHPVVDQEYGERSGGVKDAFGNHWYIATHKGASYVPAGLRSVTPYLHPRGTDKLIEFLKQGFGAEEAECHRSPDGTVVHAKIGIGDSVVEMGEAHGQWQPMPAALHLYVPDVDSVYRRAMEAGAVSEREPADQPYGDRAAGVRDPAGNVWYLATYIKREAGL